jgi:hypothetical protein
MSRIAPPNFLDRTAAKIGLIVGLAAIATLVCQVFDMSVQRTAVVSLAVAAAAAIFLYRNIIKRVPPAFSTGMLVLGATFLAGSLAGSFSQPSMDPATDISGNWQYNCDALDRKYSHGGDLVIKTRMTPYGPQWQLAGTRRWRVIDGTREEISYNWSTEWGAFTDNDRIKYTYQIATDKGVVIGCADGAITEWKNGRPARMAGRFYQLPPLDPMYGSYVFVKST